MSKITDFTELDTDIMAKAEEAGFTCALIPVSDLEFRPGYRIFCEENLCGNYNKNYACPPACGTTQEMEERTKPYRKAMILRTDWKVMNAMDPTETKPLKMQHNKQALQVIRYCKNKLLQETPLVIMAGPCSLCRTCRMQEGQPCLMEMERYSCLSAYCIDVSSLAEAAGMGLSWEADQASFFSIVLYNE